MPKSGSDLQRLVSTAIVFKRNREREGIEREFRATEYFYDYFGNLVAEPINFFFEDGFWYLVLKHAGTNLYDLVKSGKAFYADFSHAVSLLAKLHHQGMEGFRKGELALDDLICAETYTDVSGVERPNQANGNSLCFTNRIEDIFFNQFEAAGNKLDEAAKTALISNYWAVNEVLASAEKTVYTDANWRNFLKSPADVISKIDFEKLRLWPAQGDLVNLLEFGIFLSEEERRQLLSRYIEEAESLSKKKIDRNAFLRVYEFAAFHRHLELVGYRAKDWAEAKDEETKKENMFAQAYHYRMAQMHLEEIIKFAESRQRAALENLKSALYDLNLFEEETALERLIEQQKKRVMPALVKAVVPVAFLLFAGGVYTFNHLQLEQQATRAPMPKVFSSQILPEQVPAIQRNKVAFIGRKDRLQELYVVDFNYKTRNLGHMTDFSWIGSNKLVFTQGNTIKLVDLDSNLENILRNDREMDFREIVASTKGIIAVVEKGSTVYLTDSSLQGLGLFVKASEEAAILAPSWSPDGNYFSFVSSGKKGDRLYVVDYSTKKIHEGPQLDLFPSYSTAWSPDSQEIAFTIKIGKKVDIFIAKKDFSLMADLTSQRTMDSSTPLWLDAGNLLFVSGNRVYRISHEGAKPGLLTPEDMLSHSPILADGRIIYTSASAGSDSGALFSMGYGGESRTRIADFSGRRTTAAVVKDRLFYYSTEKGLAVLNAVNLDGSEKRAIDTLAAISLMK